MTPAEALALAEKHAEAGMVVDHTTLRETDFGFYFHVASEAYLRTGDMMDMPVDSCGVLVDRKTGHVHGLGSAFDLQYWLDAYDRGLHLPTDVIVLTVSDRQRAAFALERLQMSYVIPEVAYGETWTVPRHYNTKDFVRSFDSLPSRFERQNLIFRMHELDAIATNTDLTIALEPHADG
ncbi:Immunity protein 35 [Neorhodopirellula lusitana]|uniref:Immunity protein 35 n=1 Tax=Neorhodopirellula lusitana TaxID=445327 RepID=A0ABY1QMI9_9BACT|nr:YrhB domain-containing protein [Neorhodopirellula lusitana]SMP75024.1 Immunity protein 35 [Neorhodopirellula lusitana]